MLAAKATQTGFQIAKRVEYLIYVFFIYDLQLSLIESLPSVAIHGFVLPLALQWISPMLNRDTNP